MIIGLSGTIGSGKTTAGKILSELLPNFKLIAFADLLKDVSSMLLSIPRNLFDTNEGKETLIPFYYHGN